MKNAEDEQKIQRLGLYGSTVKHNSIPPFLCHPGTTNHPEEVVVFELASRITVGG